MSARSKKIDAKTQRNSDRKDKQWDEVSEASWESFPASDPPAWTMRRPRDPFEKEGEAGDESKKPRDR